MTMRAAEQSGERARASVAPLFAGASRSVAASSPPPPPKAAALIIGNEVLTGKIHDSNSLFLARLLYARGVDLVRIGAQHCAAAAFFFTHSPRVLSTEVVPDEPSSIGERCRALSALVGESGFVFTSGGIGPTHDDITYESVAGAFGRRLEVHAPTVERMKVHYGAQGKEVNAARLRMATLPEGCTVHDTGSWVPLVQLKNVYILPGIPWLFKSMLEANAALFSGPAMLSGALWTHQGEGEIAETLTAIAATHPGVAIGSYPNTQRGGEKSYATKLTFDSRDAAELEAALGEARAAFTTFIHA